MCMCDLPSVREGRAEKGAWSTVTHVSISHK